MWNRIALGLAGCLAIGAGVALPLSASPATAIPAGTIHGCVDTSTSTRALVGVYTSNTNGLTCPSGSMQVIFPKGPTTAGPSGLDIATVIGSGAGSTDVATCPADHPFVIGGGFAVESGGPIIENHPQTAGSWVASVSGGQVAAWAICSR